MMGVIAPLATERRRGLRVWVAMVGLAALLALAAAQPLPTAASAPVTERARQIFVLPQPRAAEIL